MRLPTLALASAAWLLAVACGSRSSGEAPSSAYDAGPDVVVEAPSPTTARVALPDVLAAGLDEPRGLVLVGDSLYVAERGAGRVVVVPRTGGEPRVVVTGLHAPVRLASDGETIVVTESDEISTFDRDGHVRVLAGGVAPSGPVRFHEGDVYSLEGAADAGALVRRSLDGGTRSLATGIAFGYDLAVQGDVAYFTAKGVVFAAPLDGDGGAPVVSTTESPLGVAADDAHLYWAARKGGSVGSSEGWIRRVARDGGAPERLVEVPYGPDRVVVHGMYAYFSNYQVLARVPLAGGPREDLALHTSVADLVVTDDSVYWTDADSGKLFALRLSP